MNCELSGRKDGKYIKLIDVKYTMIITQLN